MSEVIIIGAGIGGICTGIRLLKKGLKVTILEKESKAGGRVNLKVIDGIPFDLTASVLINKEDYIEIFKDVDVDYKRYVNIIDIQKLYKVFYYDGFSFDIYKSCSKMEEILNKFDEDASSSYFKITNKSYKKYKLAKRYFLSMPMLNIKDMLSYEALANMIKISPMKSSYIYIKKYVKNKRVLEYLLFKTMYIGVNPYKSSNIFTLIPAITQVEGLCYIKGGVYEYIKGLVNLFNDLGGIIKYNIDIKNIVVDKGCVIGVKSDTKYYNSDITISNADYCYTQSILNKKSSALRKNKLFNLKQSCSVFIIYLLIDTYYEGLNIHNIYISDNFKESIEAAFKNKIPSNKSLYLYYMDAIEKGIGGKTRLNIMLRVPNLTADIVWNDNLICSLREDIISEIEKIEGLDDIRSHIIGEDYLTPNDLKGKFNCVDGNAFGMAHTLYQSNCFRGDLKDKNIKNLYYIGASTHPGNGVSVVMQGAKILSNLIK